MMFMIVEDDNLQDLLNERVAEGVASTPHDFTVPHQAPFRRVFIICRSITNIILPPGSMDRFFSLVFL